MKDIYLRHTNDPCCYGINVSQSDINQCNRLVEAYIEDQGFNVILLKSCNYPDIIHDNPNHNPEVITQLLIDAWDYAVANMNP